MQIVRKIAFVSVLALFAIVGVTSVSKAEISNNAIILKYSSIKS